MEKKSLNYKSKNLKSLEKKEIRQRKIRLEIDIEREEWQGNHSQLKRFRKKETRDEFLWCGAQINKFRES